MIPRNILLISFKKIAAILSVLVLIFFMAGCGGGGGGGDTDKGSLMVTLKTDSGVEIPAGAQWRRIVDDSWLNSGDTQSDLEVGRHTVEFKEVADWIKPNNLTVNIVKNETATAIGTYIARGSDVDTVTVTGKVDDGTANSPISKAKCVFVDLNGAQHYSDDANDDGKYEFVDVLPDMEGYIRCNHPEILKLELSTFLGRRRLCGSLR